MKRWLLILLLGIYTLSAYLILPSFIDIKSPYFVDKTINLGLDLRGGSQLLLEIDFDNYLKEQYKFIVSDIRREMRKEKLGYHNLKALGDYITIKLRDSGNYRKFKKIISRIDRNLTTDKSGESVKIYFNDNAILEIQKNLMSQSIEIVRRRVDETGVTEPIIQPRGIDKIDLQVPGLDSPAELKKLLGKTAKLTFQLVNEEATEAYYEGNKIIYSDSELVSSVEEDRKYIVKREVVLAGNDLVDAKVVFDGGQPVVSFKFNNSGAKKFAEITRENAGRRFAILLDHNVISAPMIREPILGGSGIITGNFTTESANELAMLLRAGALPAELKILEERSIGPNIGSDSIESGKMAGILAFVLVAMFMIVVYRSLGVFANISLLMNLILVFGLLWLLDATFTLPGIAGIILTMGMAVDANILIFERIKEELRSGYSVTSSVINGFQNAFTAIFDSNITTLIVAIALYVFGSGPVKGFAVTLGTGIIASMISNVFFTKEMMLFWIENFKIKKLSI